MQLAMTLLFVFLLAGYSFAFGCEFGYRIYRKPVFPTKVIEPQFRLYRNPNSKNTQGHKNSLERR